MVFRIFSWSDIHLEYTLYYTDILVTNQIETIQTERKKIL